jgi:hypothetical protein
MTFGGVHELRKANRFSSLSFPLVLFSSTARINLQMRFFPLPRNQAGSAPIRPTAALRRIEIKRRRQARRIRIR